MFFCFVQNRCCQALMEAQENNWKLCGTNPIYRKRMQKTNVWNQMKSGSSGVKWKNKHNINDDIAFWDYWASTCHTWCATTPPPSGCPKICGVGMCSAEVDSPVWDNRRGVYRFLTARRTFTMAIWIEIHRETCGILRGTIFFWHFLTLSAAYLSFTMPDAGERRSAESSPRLLGCVSRIKVFFIKCKVRIWIH